MRAVLQKQIRMLPQKMVKIFFCCFLSHPGINDEEDVREKYLTKMLERIEKHTGENDLSSRIEYKKSYCVSDFISDYNAFQGNAYGLSNTLSQTAVLKPKIKNKKSETFFIQGN